MKSSWISSAAAERAVRLAVAATVALVALTLAAPPPAAAARGKEASIEDLTNFLLGPSYSQWLVGAISELATESERAEYLRLTSDEGAAEFIDAFWRRRDDPDRPWPQEQAQGIFERRAAEADRNFTEGTRLGRRTDRGQIHILYGPPEAVDYAPVAPPRRGTVEIWSYPQGAEPGLTGERPRREYYFLKQGEVTAFYNPSVRDRRRSGRGR